MEELWNQQESNRCSQAKITREIDKNKILIHARTKQQNTKGSTQTTSRKIPNIKTRKPKQTNSRKQQLHHATRLHLQLIVLEENTNINCIVATDQNISKVRESLFIHLDGNGTTRTLVRLTSYEATARWSKSHISFFAHFGRGDNLNHTMLWNRHSEERSGSTKCWCLSFNLFSPPFLLLASRVFSVFLLLWLGVRFVPFFYCSEEIHFGYYLGRSRKLYCTVYVHLEFCSL